MVEYTGTQGNVVHVTYFQILPQLPHQNTTELYEQDMLAGMYKRFIAFIL